MKSIKLNLGCGAVKLNGYLNIDLDSSVEPDLVATHSALPFSSTSIDVIEIYHSIEHMYLWEAEAAIKEWFRVLKPGGRLVVECPDIRKSIRYMYKRDDFGRYSNKGMWGLYGDPNHKSVHYGHHWGYTPESLSAILVRAGFGNVLSVTPKTHVPERDMRLEATKPLIERYPFESLMDVAVQPRIFWMLIGSRDTASSRIHGYRLHDYFSNQGWESHILIDPAQVLRDVPLTAKDFSEIDFLQPNDIVAIQKFTGPRTCELLDWLSGIGVKTVYIDSDMPLKLEEASLATWTVCPSAYLTSEYRKHGLQRAVYIPDAVEVFTAPRPSSEKKTLRCVWFGRWANSRAEEIAYIQQLLNLGNFNDMDLLVISDNPKADIQWNLSTFYTHLHACDFAILPAKCNGDANAKSSNRALQAMALGLPVIASPIPAYQEVVYNGYNGFLCNTDEEWLNALQQMGDPQVRQVMSQNAYAFSHEYSIEVIGALWMTFLRNIVFDENLKTHTIRKHNLRVGIRRMRARGFARTVNHSSSRSIRFQRLSRAVMEWPVEKEIIKVLLSPLYRQAKSLGVFRKRR